MRKKILLIVCFLFSMKTYCQVINGSIKDKVNGEPLIGATVLIKGTTIGASADVNGNFTLNLNRPFPVTLVCSYVGYVNQEQTVTSEGKNVVFLMATVQTNLKEISITDQRLSEKQREAPLTVEAMDIIAIKETPAANFYEGLGQLKGVDLTSASIGFKVINTRGFNSTSPVRSLQIIDGVDNQSPGLNFSLGNFLGCSEMDVLKVELVAGASSAFYGPNAFNGVISMQTRSPFIKPGFEVSVKSGTRGLIETAMRYAVVFKNKDKVDKLGFKFNAFFMKAKDWEANNLAATPQSRSDVNNPGRYDAVNIYGDEYNGINDASSRPAGAPGLGIYYRKGYAEKDLVDYNTENIKLCGAVHYKVRPENEIIYTSSLGYGSTVYQGDNRYSLKDIRFYQNKIEYRKKDKFFIRFYETHEDAGKSYDAYFTALLMQRAAKKDEVWNVDYLNYYNQYIRPRVMNMPGYITPYQGYGQSYLDSLQNFLSTISDSLTVWHNENLNYASTHVTNPANTQAYYEPGTAQFDSAFQAITSSESFSKGGSRFFDRSALYHAQGEYKINVSFTDVNSAVYNADSSQLKSSFLRKAGAGFINFFNGMEITLGASGRMYRPNSHGTIFSDSIYYVKDTIYNPDNTVNRIDSTEKRNKITNTEYGVYFGIGKKILHEKLNLNATARLDKNENFDYLFSPAVSGVYTVNENHIIRATFSSAIRNPTLTDQYLYYPVGRALLIGNINGYDSIATIESMIATLNTDNEDSLKYFSVSSVQPEKVKTIEVGYRATLFQHLYMDLNYYFSFYDDFIGYRIGAKVPIIYRTSPFAPTDTAPDYNNIKILRIASNAADQVTTMGASIGLNYLFAKFFSINGNYSFNRLNKESDDPLVPAYNTPKHKFNIGISGRDIITEKIKNWGFNINYKWVQGFLFEGSPQFTGNIDTYDLVDFQINKKFPEQHTTFKIGVQNLLNNKHYEVYGGPLVGRLAYFQVNVEIN